MHFEKGSKYKKLTSGVWDTASMSREDQIQNSGQMVIKPFPIYSHSTDDRIAHDNFIIHSQHCDTSEANYLMGQLLE